MDDSRSEQGRSINVGIYNEQLPGEDVIVHEQGVHEATGNAPSHEAQEDGEESWDDEIDFSKEYHYKARPAGQSVQEESTGQEYHEEDIEMAMRQMRLAERDRQREREYARNNFRPYNDYDSYQDGMIRNVSMHLEEAKRDKQDLEREIERLALDTRHNRRDSEQDLQLVRIKSKVARLQATVEDDIEAELKVKELKQASLRQDESERKKGASTRQTRRPTPSLNFENHDESVENELSDSDSDLEEVSKPQFSKLQLTTQYNKPHAELQRLGLVDEINSPKNKSEVNDSNFKWQPLDQYEPNNGSMVNIVNIVGTMFDKAHQSWKLHLLSTAKEDSKLIDFQWLRVQTKSMCLDEFFDFALKFPAKSDVQRKLILNIREKLEETKCNQTVHGNLLEPGAVLRSDEMNHDRGIRRELESATFCCIPFCYFTKSDQTRVTSEKSYPEIPILQALHQFQSTEFRDKEQMPQTLLNSVSDLLVVGQVWCLLLPSGLFTYSTGELKSLFGSDLVISDINKDSEDLESFLIRVSTQSSRRFMKKVSKDCSLFDLEAKLWADYQRYLRNSKKLRAISYLERSLDPIQWQIFENRQDTQFDKKGALLEPGHRRHPMRTKFMDFHRQMSYIKQDWNLKTISGYFLDASTTKHEAPGVQENICSCPQSCKPLMYLLSDLPNPRTKEPPSLTYESTEGARLSHNIECLMAKLPKTASTARHLLLAQKNSVSIDSLHGQQILTRSKLSSVRVKSFSGAEEHNNTEESMEAVSDKNSSSTSLKVGETLSPYNRGDLFENGQDFDLDTQSAADLLSWETAKLDEMMKFANLMAEKVVVGSTQILAYYLPESDESDFKVQYLTLLDSIMSVSENISSKRHSTNPM
jgi:hypothetical protein